MVSSCVFDAGEPRWIQFGTKFAERPAMDLGNRFNRAKDVPVPNLRRVLGFWHTVESFPAAKRPIIPIRFQQVRFCISFFLVCVFLVPPAPRNQLKHLIIENRRQLEMAYCLSNSFGHDNPFCLYGAVFLFASWHKSGVLEGLRTCVAVTNTVRLVYHSADGDPRRCFTI
ncbi:hypothetical protein F5146DRAFT_199897 [Armillaria mellea]|nr:hypothetical protein F5146DRAFT_199897 [Armillaria mellea]